MSYFENYVRENINEYPLDRSGYPDLKNYDPLEELVILSREDEDLMDEVFTHHIEDPKAAQINLVKAMYGDWQANLRFLAAVKAGMKSYFDYKMDDLAAEELLKKWQDDYAKEYAREAAIEAQVVQMEG
jgi:hypothetical protein